MIGACRKVGTATLTTSSVSSSSSSSQRADVALDAVPLGQRGAHGLLEPGDPGELDAG